MKRGQFVTIVTASDEDSSDAHNLAYSIVGGNEKQAFTIEEYSGTHNVLLLTVHSQQISFCDEVEKNPG